METADMRAPRIRAPRGALNPEGIECEKNWQVLRITSGQFPVFNTHGYLSAGGAPCGDSRGLGRSDNFDSSGVHRKLSKASSHKKKVFQEQFSKILILITSGSVAYISWFYAV